MRTAGAALGDEARGDVTRAAGGLDISPRAANLAQRLENWLRREALLGALVLACVALLAAFAGTLAAPAGAAPANAGTGPFTGTATAGAYALTLRVSPDRFGTNTFIVRASDEQGKPVVGAGVSITTSDLDMDMGQQTVQLQPVAGQSGSYSGQGDLTMAGHWQVVVRLLPPNTSHFVSTTFTFSATY